MRRRGKVWERKGWGGREGEREIKTSKDAEGGGRAWDVARADSDRSREEEKREKERGRNGSDRDWT